MTFMSTDHWRTEAENWVRWARTPNHDAYWQYQSAFFDELVPPSGGIVLDIGCGEGRTTRDLSSRGHRAIGVDASNALVRYAQDADPEGNYAVADAASLPFVDTSFDLAVAYNSLMDVDDMPGSVAEAARVLRPGGRFCVCVTHPLTDAGEFERREPDAPFIIQGDYLTKRVFDETFERAGLSMRFRGWCYPLEDYGHAFEAAGLLVESLREPAVPDEAVENDPAERRWQRLPLFLFLRLVKPPSLLESPSART